MKQYQFKLQTVLDFRTEQFHQVQQKVAEVESEKFKILTRIQEYDAVIEQAFLHQQTQMEQGSLELSQLQNFPDYIWRLKQLRFETFQAMQRQEEILLTVREELKQALIKKKSLEILKDKSYSEYRIQIEKAEEEFMAEIALNRNIRQNRHF